MEMLGMGSRVDRWTQKSLGNKGFGRMIGSVGNLNSNGASANTRIQRRLQKSMSKEMEEVSLLSDEAYNDEEKLQDDLVSVEDATDSVEEESAATFDGEFC
jgi:hypothetical protein